MTSEKIISLLLNEFRQVSKKKLKELARYYFVESSLVLAERLHEHGDFANDELSQAFVEALEAEILSAAQIAAMERGIAI